MLASIDSDPENENIMRVQMIETPPTRIHIEDQLRVGIFDCIVNVLFLISFCEVLQRCDLKITPIVCIMCIAQFVVSAYKYILNRKIIFRRYVPITEIYRVPIIIRLMHLLIKSVVAYWTLQIFTSDSNWSLQIFTSGFGSELGKYPVAGVILYFNMVQMFSVAFYDCMHNCIFQIICHESPQNKTCRGKCF